MTVLPGLRGKFTELSRGGRTPKVKDLLIASSAISHDKLLITCDKDFEIFNKFGLKLKLL